MDLQLSRIPMCDAVSSEGPGSPHVRQFYSHAKLLCGSWQWLASKQVAPCLRIHYLSDLLRRWACSLQGRGDGARMALCT